MEKQCSTGWGVRQMVWLLLLVSLSFAGNVWAPGLFTGFNYLLGSVGVLLILRLFGLAPALVAALLAAAWCKQLFGHFYPLLWLGLEPLFVWYWCRRRPQDSMIMADTVFWVALGGPLVLVVFLAVLGMPLLGTGAAALMYATIGIINALLATLLLTQLPITKWVWPGRQLQQITLDQLIFQVLMLAIVLPALLVLVFTGRERERTVKQTMFDTLEIKARQVGQEVRQKIYHGVYPPTFDQTQHEQLNVAAVTAVLRSIVPKSGVQLHLMANQGEVLASTDPEVAKLKQYEPLAHGVASRTEREHLYRLLPANAQPIPLWQRVGKSRYVRINRFPGTTVYSIAEASFAPYQAQILRGHRNALTGLLLYLAAGTLLATVVARRIAVPLVQLSRTTTDLPGRLMSEDLYWPESRIVEVQQLVENAREMSHTLSGQFREIGQINAELEQRVSERTRELSESNESLRQEIDERISAERQRDQLLRELETKNKELESIIYVSSHDLRSPLVNIQGFSRKLAKSCATVAEMLEEGRLSEEQHQEARKLLTEQMPRSVTFITSSVEKMDSLLSGLLKLSRLGRAAITIENLDMNQVMGKITNSLAFQIEATNAVVTVEELLPCQGDAVQISQIFTNLLDNAIKYRAADRRLQVTVSSRQCDGGVEYCVQDNGIGIHPDYQSQIWEIFHRINPRDIPGEGLGLTVSRRILDRLNGSIRVESEEGVGSRFLVVLPADRN
jgi:signal transduction histidine kinase